MKLETTAITALEHSRERRAWVATSGFRRLSFYQVKGTFDAGLPGFSDVFPGTLATSFDTNSPLENTFVAPRLQLAPGLPGSAQTATTASNNAFVSGFGSGLNIGEIEAGPGGALFRPPLFTNAANSMHYPTDQEWNIKVQQALGSKMSISLNYVGNHGSKLALQDPGLNAYCNSTPFRFEPAAQTPCITSLGITSFTGASAYPRGPSLRCHHGGLEFWRVQLQRPDCLIRTPLCALAVASQLHLEPRSGRRF